MSDSYIDATSKLNQITIFIVGHVTRSIGGPRMLEQDTVLYFEGDKHHSFPRASFSEKPFWIHQRDWRFRRMSLRERLAGATGCSAVSLEGTRPIFNRVQCLLSPAAEMHAVRQVVADL